MYLATKVDAHGSHLQAVRNAASSEIPEPQAQTQPSLVKTPLSCPYEGCQIEFATVAVRDAHLSVCAHRSVRHKRCGLTILARDLPRHAFLCSTAPKPERKRVALLVACTDYTVSESLANPLADARLLAVVLGRLGFAVITVENPGREQFDTAMTRFCAGIQDPSAIAFFAYFGHGNLDANGRNTLVLCDESTLDASTEVGSRITESASRPLFSVLVFDCCRVNGDSSSSGNGSGGGDARSRSGASGRMLPMDFPATLVALSCGFGQRAVDGDGTTECSPFARILARILSEDDAGRKDVRVLFERMARDLWVQVGQRATIVANLHEFGGGGVDAQLA
ncbi:hypothetical protein HDU86_001467 [Geranomyces michiganensis]|nr:hypothetical protein HDU86_001467 [Geranomyces michiganensis]